AVLDPVLERGQRVDDVRPRPADAVLHAGRGEEADVPLNAAEVIERQSCELLVIKDGPERRQRRIAEPVVDEELLVQEQERQEAEGIVAVADLGALVEERERAPADRAVLDVEVAEVEARIPLDDELEEMIDELPGDRRR